MTDGTAFFERLRAQLKKEPPKSMASGGMVLKEAAVLAPVVQILASVPATALFPVVHLSLLRVPFGQNIAAVLLMLMGTQWYLLFNVIAGRLPPTSGRVTMAGEDITGLAPHELFGKGLLRTFQIAHEFGSMTVRENLMMVPARQSGESLLNAMFRRGAVADEEKRIRDKADEVLDFLTISHLADQRASNISGGQKKLLELGRTMMVDAKIVFSTGCDAAWAI